MAHTCRPNVATILLALAFLAGCSSEEPEVSERADDPLPTNELSASPQIAENAPRDSNGASESAAYILNLFSRYCDETDLHLGTIYNRLLAGGWVRLPVSQTDTYIEGILPYDRVGFARPDTRMPIVILSAQGEITAQSRRMFDGGLKSVSARINRAVPVPDILGLGTPPHLGLKNCRVIARTNDVDGFISAISSMSVFGEPIGRIDLSQIVMHKGVSYQNYNWQLENGTLNVSYELPANLSGRMVNIEISRLVYPDDASASYRFSAE